jgi:hypothetical protein
MTLLTPATFTISTINKRLLVENIQNACSLLVRYLFLNPLLVLLSLLLLLLFMLYVATNSLKSYIQTDIIKFCITLKCVLYSRGWLYFEALFRRNVYHAFITCSPLLEALGIEVPVRNVEALIFHFCSLHLSLE